MLFNSLNFLYFLSICLLCFYASPLKFRWGILLIASYVFCGLQNVESLIVLLIITGFNFFWGRLLAGQQKPKKRKGVFFTGIILNIGSLLTAKYFLFSNYAAVITADNIVIIVGFSYYLLQNIAYLKDIFIKLISPEQNIGKFALYIAFFPKFLSGPIITSQEFIPQIKENKSIDINSFFLGLQRILLGFFKKIVLAEGLAYSVNNVLDNPENLFGFTSLIGVYFFTLQLYLDLSGYTDIAVGTAHLFGFRLKENFNFPFLARSITEFWRKWHMSLIEWLTTYLYYPIVFELRNLRYKATLAGIIITFLISGLWHGLGLNFIIWGAINAAYMCYELLTKKARTKASNMIPSFIYNPISIFITFNLVCFSNLFIRLYDTHKIWKVIKEIFSLEHFVPLNYNIDFLWQLTLKGEQEYQFNFYMTLVWLFIFLLTEKIIQRSIQKQKFNFIYVFFMILLLIAFGNFTSSEQFIYVQF